MRVLIIDDHEAVRKALRRMLTAENFDVCGEAADGEAAIQVAQRLKPDVILMDLLLPGMSGIDAGRAVLKEFPAMPIVLMTTLDPDIVDAARAAGFRGAVSKGSGNFVVTLNAILQGEQFHQG